MVDIIPGDLLGARFPVTVFAASAGLAALVALVLIRLLHPLLVRYALARPNARSSHSAPTPQGGGIAVLAATFVAATGPVALFGGTAALPGWAGIAGAGTCLAVLGGIDDIRPLPASIRLVVQLASVALVVALLDPPRLLPEPVPLALERTILVVAGGWWVNLVNFMDGIDWITVAEFVPLTATLALLGVAGILPPIPAVAAAALFGALLGFAPANRPVARLFLGDVGSLPIGLLSGWMLLALASAGHLAAALLLPLYYLADATLTLLRRALRRERVWEAHRTHFYQRARDSGFSVREVDARVFGLNLILAVFAAGTIARPGLAIPALLAGAALVALLLRRFATKRSV